MARTVAKLPGPGYARRKYPWPTWLNGEVWELTPGEDFVIPVENFRNQVQVRASNQKIPVRTRVQDGKLYIQAQR